MLVYLVALQGWPFVTDDAVATSAKPAAISDATGIQGGTLRPILKDLKDTHLIAVKNGAYSVRATHLQSVNAEIEGSMQSSGRKKVKRNTSSRKKTASKKKASKKRANSGKPKRAPGQMFSSIIEEGFFDDGKTAKDVQERFHEETIMVSASVLSPYFVKAVGSHKTLTRKKEDVDGRQVWVYPTKK